LRDRRVVKRYARMFFNTVGAEAVPGAINELTMVSEIMSRSREFRGLLENPLFKRDEREGVMKRLSERLRLSEETVRLIVYLSEQRMITALPELINAVAAIYLDRKKRARALVKTPIDINMRYDERLRAVLKNLTGRDVDIEYVVEPSLIGGVMIRVGSTLYDSSIKGQLGLLKDELVKG